jgi:glycosyltransferase involved in cell wall biosynthesis
MKINILEMHSSLGYAGGQRNMVTFVKYLRKDIFNVSVIAYRVGGPLETVLKELGIPYMVAHNDVAKIIEFIKAHNIDVIHIHRSGGSVPFETQFLTEAKKYNPNIVIIQKNVFGKYDPTVSEIMDCSFLQSIMHLNERYLVAAQKDFDFNKEKVLYNMVDAEEFERYRVSAAEIMQYKKELGVDPNNFIVGKVARPALEKWSDLIIEMMPFLVKKIPHVKIVIIGCPPSRMRYIERSAYKKFFCLLPETSDQAKLHLFYQAIDVLAHSSKIGECNGNTINEAMFWRKPVLVNSTPRKDNGQLEQVKHKVSGIIANTPPTLAQAITWLANNPQEYAKMATEAYKQVSVVNQPRAITEQVEKFLVEKMASRHSSASLSLCEEYAKIEYNPSQNDIVNYHSEYQKRLTWDFADLTLFETITLLQILPRRFYFKVRDFIEHKWFSYVKR